MADDKEDKGGFLDALEAFMDDGMAIGKIAKSGANNDAAGPEDYDAARETIKLLTHSLQRIGEEYDETSNGIMLGWDKEQRTYRLIWGQGVQMIVIEGSITEIVAKLAAGLP